MLLIKKKSGSTMNDLLSHYQTYYGQRKSRTRINEIIADITKKQEKYNRVYIERKKSGSYRYIIPSEKFVDRRNTALLLLEIASGYEHIGGFDDLFVESFKKYIFQKYGNSITDIDACLEQSQSADLIELIDHQSADGTVIKGIRRLPRLTYDTEYFILLAVDFLKDLRKSFEEIEQKLVGLDPTQPGFKKTKTGAEKQKKKVSKKIDHVGKLLAIFKPNAVDN